MRILLATGIYPPDFGGPATYVKNLAAGLQKKGEDVTVITYSKEAGEETMDGVRVIRIARSLPVVRWFAYAKALKRYGKRVDVIYIFSSVSCGVPLWLSGLKRPKRVLRLGGDFLWERYTDMGGTLSLVEWYRSSASSLAQTAMQMILSVFDHIIFSTSFQSSLYREHYRSLPRTSVLENALPSGEPVIHQPHKPFRLLFLGRFVGFKNIASLIEATDELSECTLTIVGDGPLASELKRLAASNGRIQFKDPVKGKEKMELFASHELLVLPSLTEISPHTALEARLAGLPVLLTHETGLSEQLSQGIQLAKLRNADDIAAAIRRIINDYDQTAQAASASPQTRNWDTVVAEHLVLFQQL